MKKITAIRESLDKAINDVEIKVASSMTETHFNEAVSIYLPQHLNASKVFPGVRFGGCYIHQSPKATFLDDKAQKVSCEVGDLLAICHQYVDGSHRYNAALVQWKVIHSGIDTLTGSELNQLYLYEHWPAFKLNNSLGSFNILPKSVTPGAQYGLIQPSPKLLHTIIPARMLDLSDSVTFSRFLYSLMKWQTGRPFDLNSEVDEWSRLINKLIFNSCSRYYNLRSAKSIKRPRTNGRFLFDLLYNVNEDQIRLQEDGFENDAISMIVMDIKELEQ